MMSYAYKYAEPYIPEFETYQLLTYLACCFEYPWSENTQKTDNITETIFQVELNEKIIIPPLTMRQEEYTKLFINHIPHTLAPPYEAYYIENNQNVLSSLHQWYARLGYVNGRERADHIVAELQFVALLSQDGQNKMAYEFIEDHLYQWIIPFTEKIICTARTNYFCLMGKLAAHLMERIRREELL